MTSAPSPECVRATIYHLCILRDSPRDLTPYLSPRSPRGSIGCHLPRMVIFARPDLIKGLSRDFEGEVRACPSYAEIVLHCYIPSLSLLLSVFSVFDSCFQLAFLQPGPISASQATGSTPQSRKDKPHLKVQNLGSVRLSLSRLST